jgi:hypothetical protein
MAEHPDARGGQREPPSGGDVELAPARGEDPQHVAVGEGEHVAFGGVDALQQPVDPDSDLRRRLPAGTALRPKVPVGAGLVDLRGGQSLVLAVVPLVQVVGELRGGAKATQLAGLARPQQRAAQDQRVADAGQGVRGAARLGAALTSTTRSRRGGRRSGGRPFSDRR